MPNSVNGLVNQTRQNALNGMRRRGDYVPATCRNGPGSSGGRFMPLVNGFFVADQARLRLYRPSPDSDDVMSVAYWGGMAGGG